VLARIERLQPDGDMRLGDRQIDDDLDLRIGEQFIDGTGLEIEFGSFRLGQIAVEIAPPRGYRGSEKRMSSPSDRRPKYCRIR
jgi:hypothetical protein